VGASNGKGSIGPDGSTPQDPSSIHSENGFGSSSKVPGVSPAATLTGAGVPAPHTAGSALPTYLLLVLIVASAAAVGLVAGRGTQRGSSTVE
jgi:hypothetical protein